MVKARETHAMARAPPAFSHHRHLDMRVPWYQRKVPLPRIFQTNEPELRSHFYVYDYRRASKEHKEKIKKRRNKMPLYSLQAIDYIEGRSAMPPLVPYDHDAYETERSIRKKCKKGIYPYMTIINEIVTDDDVKKFNEWLKTNTAEIQH